MLEVTDADAVVVGVSDELEDVEPVCVDEGDVDAVEVPVGVCEALAVEDRLTEGVAAAVVEELAPTDREAVGDEDIEIGADCVLVGVMVDDGVGVGVLEGVSELDMDDVAVGVSVGRIDGVSLALLPVDNDGVNDCDVEGSRDCDELAVSDAVGVSEALGVGVGVDDGVVHAVEDGLATDARIAPCDMDAVSDDVLVGVPVGDAVDVADGVGDGDGVGDSAGNPNDCVELPLAPKLTVAVIDADSVGDGVIDGVPVVLLVAVPDGLLVLLGVTDGVGVPDAVILAVTESLVVAESEGKADTLGTLLFNGDDVVRDDPV
jgi:hypothetical protein